MSHIKKSFMRQIISSTHVDSHGEKRDKAFFETLISKMPKRFPLHQQHDMGMVTLGYLENFDIIEDEKESGEFLVVADVHITSDNIDEALRGFSYSITEVIGGDVGEGAMQIFLPFPHYNDTDLVDELITDGNVVGKWIKKAADPATIAIIASCLYFIFRPEWETQYKERIRPSIIKATGYAKKLLGRNIKTDFVQTIEFNKAEVQIYFIPERVSQEQSLTEPHIYKGLKSAHEFLITNPKAATVGIERIKMLFAKDRDSYYVYHVQYADGSDEHILA